VKPKNDPIPSIPRPDFADWPGCNLDDPCPESEPRDFDPIPDGSRTLEEFETEHGGSRIGQMQAALDAVARKARAVDVEIPSPDNTIRFGVVSDTHFGSLYEALDQLRAFYRFCAALGIRTVLHAGDVLEGHRIYRGQEYEQHKTGFDAQARWFAEQAPGREEGIVTHFITGNHDASFTKAAGIGVGPALQSLRPDWQFIGADYGRVDLTAADGRRWRVLLVHPDGGTPYAISYRAQGIIRDLEGGSKPNMVCVGHLHKALLIPTVRNIATYQAGCFQWQTPFMQRKPTDAHVGGWIVKVTPGAAADLNNSINSRFIAFYAPGAEAAE
jgi:hypothetical protein